MRIVHLSIKNIKPYENNAKLHPTEQIEQIAQSIKDFGFNDPIAVDENNIIIEGHGRYEAGLLLGLNKLPCIRLEGLTDAQKRAYILAHNKLTLNTGYDIDLLAQELDNIIEFDMTDYGFEYSVDLGDLNLDGIGDDGYYGDERERTFEAYNMDMYDDKQAVGFYDMPILKACHTIPNDLMSFNYMLTKDKFDSGIHFYIDDYQFERIWNQPNQYLERLKQFKCVCTPDFSTYLDMAMPIKIYNVYRSKLIGQWMQNNGIEVIPTLQWAEKDTFQFCFDGIESGGVVTVSTIGVKGDDESKQIWFDGMSEALKRIKPCAVLVYGGDIGFKYPDNVTVKYFDTKAFKGNEI